MEVVAADDDDDDDDYDARWARDCDGVEGFGNRERGRGIVPAVVKGRGIFHDVVVVVVAAEDVVVVAIEAECCYCYPPCNLPMIRESLYPQRHREAVDFRGLEVAVDEMAEVAIVVVVVAEEHAAVGVVGSATDSPTERGDDSETS